MVYVNREFVSQSAARISMLDHAVLYGDGIFETAVARSGMIFKLDAHIERGFRSMAAIALAPPCDRAEMRDLIIETVRRNEQKDAYIKWLVTRGSNGRPLMDPTGCVPNLIILALPLMHRDIVINMRRHAKTDAPLDRLWKDCPRVPFVDRDLAGHDVA